MLDELKGNVLFCAFWAYSAAVATRQTHLGSSRSKRSSVETCLCMLMLTCGCTASMSVLATSASATSADLSFVADLQKYITNTFVDLQLITTSLLMFCK